MIIRNALPLLLLASPAKAFFVTTPDRATTSFRLFSTLEEKQELWKEAHGSWELKLSTGDAYCHNFHPPPAFLPFSYAMIADDYFGNGVGLDADKIGISFLHKHYFDPKKRHMVVVIQDVFLFGHKITQWLPQSWKDKMNLQKHPDDFETTPPTFVIVGASENSLIARGNQSGGLALWTRLPKGIQNVAYKNYPGLTIDDDSSFDASSTQGGLLGW